MRTSVANNELISNFVCVLDPELCEINLVQWYKSCAVVRGVGRVGTHTMTGECNGLWLAKYKQIASQSPG